MDDSLRDVLLVARFELLRATRTRRALAFTVLYLVAACGAAFIFIKVIGSLENTVATELGAPSTRYPGTLTHELVQKESFRTSMTSLMGSEHVAELLGRIPLLALFNQWFGLLALPFFAAAASAESISLDAASRALRFEVLRTGRLELVLGRFLGQLALVALACLCAAVGVWVVGVVWMRGFSPHGLAFWLGVYSLRAWAFAIPFVGLGMAASQLTDSTGWARTGAVVLAGGSWVLTAVLAALGTGPDGWLPAYLLLQVMPQSWLPMLWEPGWPLAALVCAALGLGVTLLGAVRFARRHL